MTMPSKLDLVGSNSLAQLNQLPKAAAAGDTERTIVAEGGKVVPPADTSDRLAEGRKKELSHAVRAVAGYVQNITRELNFSVDETLGRTVVTVVDQTTGDVIRQIPSEDMLELSRSLAEIRERSAKGLLFRGDA